MCCFGRATFKEVMPLILNFHYAKRRCADPTAVFVMRKDCGTPIACAVFAAPANRYFGRRAVELVRLVRTPEYMDPLSGFISRCLSELRRERRFFYCLAYADTDAKHHGGIYQACSFSYIGVSKGHTMYRAIGDKNKIVSARSRDQSTAETKALLVPFKTGPKYLYVKGLMCPTAHVIERLSRESMPYPKPSQEVSS